MNLNKSDRELHLQKFLDKAFAGEEKIIGTDVRLNDDSEDEHTDFEAQMTLKVNDEKLTQVLRVHNTGTIELLCGEDFYNTNEKHFMMYCFIQALYCNNPTMG